MKKLKQARANKLMVGAFMLFAIISVFCFASTPTVKDGFKATGAVSAMFMAPLGFKKLDKQDDAGGSAEVLAKIKTNNEAQLAEWKAKMTSEFDALMRSSAEFKNLGELTEKVKNAATVEEFKKLSEQFEEIGLKVKEMGEEGHKGQKIVYKTYADVVVEIVRQAHKDGKLKDLMQAKSGMITLERKAAETMTETTSIVAIGSGPAFSLTDFDKNVTPVTRRQPFLLQLCNVTRIMTEIAAWAEQTNIDPGVAGMTAEAAAKTQGSFRWTEKKQQVENITYYTKASKQLLMDIDAMDNAIRTEIMTLLALKLDYGILLGNGTSPQLKGILNSGIQSFDAGAAAHTVASPSYWDVLNYAITQIQSKGQTPVSGAEKINLYNPNFIVLNPLDAFVMRSTKDSQYRYIVPPFVNAQGDILRNLQIVENIGMTAGSFLVGDFNMSNVRIREDANITLGFENDDFTKNLMTILGEMRAVHYIKQNNLFAFVSDTFTNGSNQLNSATT